MKRSRKPYPAEFKQEAVRLLREQRLPRSQVARDLGIDPETLRRWTRELSPKTAGAQDTAAPAVSAADLARLRRENQQLRMERDILKKGHRHLLVDARMRAKYQFVAAHASEYPITLLCPVLGLARSGVLRLARALSECTRRVRPAVDKPDPNDLYR
jgi:putative transposase